MCSVTVVSDSANPWTVASLICLVHGIASQDYWSGLPCPLPGDLPDPGIKPIAPALADFNSEPPRKSHYIA